MNMFLKIEGDRQTGRTTTLAYHMSQWLRENPQGKVGLCTASSMQGRNLIDRLVDVIGVNNMDVKRIYLFTPRSDARKGVELDVLYFDDAEYVDENTAVSLFAALQPMSETSRHMKRVIYSVETGKDPGWVTPIA